MEQNKIEELIAKYNEGLTDPSEVQQLEQLIEAGEIQLTQLRNLDRLNEQLMSVEAPPTSLKMDDRFYTMLSDEMKKQSKKESGLFSMPSWSWLLPRLAFAIVMIALGFVGGYFMNRDNSDMKLLAKEVTDLKEKMMLSLIQKESATDRLKAVSLTSEMDQVSAQVTTALFQTLNNDASVNVRLAALEALALYSRDGKVREGLIRSICKQDSPLVQLALAELMGRIQEKKSVKEFEKILEDENTPQDIKQRIQESINVLI